MNRLKRREFSQESRLQALIGNVEKHSEYLQTLFDLCKLKYAEFLYDRDAFFLIKRIQANARSFF